MAAAIIDDIIGVIVLSFVIALNGADGKTASFTLPPYGIAEAILTPRNEENK